MRAIASSPTRRAASVSSTRSRANPAMARARLRSSETSGRSRDCIAAASLALLSFPYHDDADRLVVDIRMRHGRALDVKAVALEADVTHLLAADPGLVPCRFDLGDDIAVLDAVAARVGNHRFERLRPIFVRPRQRTALAGHQRQPAALRGRNLNALRMFAVNRCALLSGDILIVHRNELPGADDLFPQRGIVGVRHDHSAVQPPSSTSAEPVISDEASEARNTMAPVSSSSWPRRPSLIFDSTSSRNALFSKNGRVIGVSRKVGPRLLTRTLCGASSIAMALVKPSMACLDAQ